VVETNKVSGRLSVARASVVEAAEVSAKALVVEPVVRAIPVVKSMLMSLGDSFSISVVESNRLPVARLVNISVTVPVVETDEVSIEESLRVLVLVVCCDTVVSIANVVRVVRLEGLHGPAATMPVTAESIRRGRTATMINTDGIESNGLPVVSRGR
jgi:uncharacterized protein YlxP (DUF503 family)